MRAAIGPALAHLTLLGAGFGVLRLIGVLGAPTLRRVLAAAGLAYLAGVAVVTVVLIALMAMGVPLSLPLFAGLCVLLALPFLAGMLRPAAWTGLRPVAGLRGLDLEGRVAAVVVVGLALFAAVGLWVHGLRVLTEFDAWQIWTRKAVLLFYGEHLPGFLSAKVYVNSQPDYPLGLPLLEALQFRAGGRPDTTQVHATTWIVFAAGIWATCFLGSRATRPFVWAGVSAGLAALLAAPAFSAYADVPVALLLGLGTLAIGLWLQGGRRSDLALGAILLAGAAVTKNEGLPGAAIVFAVALVVSLASGERRRADALAVAGAGIVTFAVAVVPWRLWMTANDVTGVMPLSKGLSPGYLIDRFDRVWPSVQALTSQLVGQPVAQITVPAAIALAVVRLRGMPRLAAYYLAVGVLYWAALVWGYWISPLGLAFQIGTSVGRIFVGPVLIAAAAIVHLAGREAPEEAPEPALASVLEAGEPVRG